MTPVVVRSSVKGTSNASITPAVQYTVLLYSWASLALREAAVNMLDVVAISKWTECKLGTVMNSCSRAPAL
jgi:hypothetical protein